MSKGCIDGEVGVGWWPARVYRSGMTIDGYGWIIIGLCAIVPVVGMTVSIVRRLRDGNIRAYRALPDIAVLYAPEVLPIIEYIRSSGHDIGTIPLKYFRPGTPNEVRCVALAFTSPQKRANFLRKITDDIRSMPGGDAALREAAPVITHKLRDLNMLVFLGALARPA